MRRRDFGIGMAVLGASGCVRGAPPAAFGVGSAFLDARLAPGRDDTLVVHTDREGRRAAAYDAALVALVLLRRARRDEAARVVLGVAATQRDDGAVPFSVVRGAEHESSGYVRSGAVAWCGYAAAEILDAAPWDGPTRARVVAFGHRVAAYLVARQVTRAGDPRDGLVTGGEGTYVADVDERGAIVERFVRGDATWASTEHNVDAFFFLRRFARVVESTAFARAAARIQDGLLRSFDEASGQLPAGVRAEGIDRTHALDAASWGAVLLAAAGERERAERSAQVADQRFGVRALERGVVGHRPFADGPIFANERVVARFGAREWSELDLVWPEGSAGVALAALRTGRPDRARAILDALEPLRDRGALPTATRAVPLQFDVEPSVAGTAWSELVRYELARPAAAPTLFT